MNRRGLLIQSKAGKSKGMTPATCRDKTASLCHLSLGGMAYEKKTCSRLNKGTLKKNNKLRPSPWLAS